MLCSYILYILDPRTLDAPDTWACCCVDFVQRAHSSLSLSLSFLLLLTRVRNASPGSTYVYFLVMNAFRNFHDPNQKSVCVE